MPTSVLEQPTDKAPRTITLSLSAFAPARFYYANQGTLGDPDAAIYKGASARQDRYSFGVNHAGAGDWNGFKVEGLCANFSGGIGFCSWTIAPALSCPDGHTETLSFSGGAGSLPIWDGFDWIVPEGITTDVLVASTLTITIENVQQWFRVRFVDPAIDPDMGYPEYGYWENENHTQDSADSRTRGGHGVAVYDTAGELFDRIPAGANFTITLSVTVTTDGVADTQSASYSGTFPADTDYEDAPDHWLSTTKQRFRAYYDRYDSVATLSGRGYFSLTIIGGGASMTPNFTSYRSLNLEANFYGSVGRVECEAQNPPAPNALIMQTTYSGYVDAFAKGDLLVTLEGRHCYPGGDPYLRTVKIKNTVLPQSASSITPGVAPLYDSQSPFTTDTGTHHQPLTLRSVHCTTALFINAVNTAINVFGIEQQGEIGVYCDRGHLDSEGLSRDQWRILHLFAGKELAVAELTHDASYTVESGASLGNWQAVNGSASQIGGAIHLLASGDNAVLWQYCTDDNTSTGNELFNYDWRNYRCLKIRVKASGSMTRQFKLTYRCWDAGGSAWVNHTKSWDLELTSSYQEFELDLCAPNDSDVTMSNDLTDTAYDETAAEPYGQLETQPVKPDDNDDAQSPVPGRNYGVGKVLKIEFLNFANTETLDVDSLTLFRKTDAKEATISIAASHQNSHVSDAARSWESDAPYFHPEGKRLLFALINYHQSDYPYAIYDAFGYEKTAILTLDDWLDRLTDAPGWTISDRLGVDIAYPVGETIHLLSNYRAYDVCEADKTFTYAWVKSCAGGYALKARLKLDRISLHPGVGDPEGADYSGAYPWRYVKFWGGKLHALAFDASAPYQALSDVPIEVRKLGVLQETIFTNAFGYAISRGLPGEADCSLITDSVSANLATQTGRARFACLSASPAASSMGDCLEVDPVRSFVAYSHAEKNSAFREEDASAVSASGDLGIERTVDMGWVARSGKLYSLCVKSGATWGLFVSNDDGETITEVISLASIGSGCLAVDPHRNKLILITTDSGTDEATTRLFDLDDESLESTDATQYSGTLTGEVFKMAHSERQGGKLYLLATIGASSYVLGSGDLGRTFELVYAIP